LRDCVKENRHKMSLLTTLYQIVCQNSDADTSAMDDEMIRRLEEMDATLRELEMDGRLLEERIRSGL